MGCCCGTRQVDDDRENRELLDEDGSDDERDIEAGLEDENVVDVQLPQVYYVIIGCGPMAVVNHRTLRESDWGQQRIGQRTVLHIGGPNPWPQYMQHGLGQPNHLLSFPAFANQPSIGGQQRDGGLDSQHFGQQITAEFDTLEKAVVVAWVGLIQTRAREAIDDRVAQEIGGGDVRDAINECIQAAWPDFPDLQTAPYRLCVYNPQTETARLIYADYIDICTGPGRPAVLPPGAGDNEAIRRARTPPWLPPELWSTIDEWANRRTMNGVDAIRNEVVWAQGERVCVTAGGGVGLNAAEKARNANCALDWFGRAGLMPIFENPRNITFLREPNTNNARAPAMRATVGINGEDDLIASSQRARMGRGAVLHSATPGDDHVEVRLAQQGQSRIRDWWGNATALNTGEGRWPLSDAYGQHVQGIGIVESRVYQRLVIPNGQQTNEVGHARSFAHHLVVQAVDLSGRLVALETADHRVRILGAACNNYGTFALANWVPNGGTPRDRMWDFHATLPISAVPDGFILCGVNTAVANRYFTDHANRNVNTMTLAELTDVVGDAIAQRLIDRRRDRNGYQNLGELQAAGESMDARLNNLLFAYPVFVAD